MGVNVGVRLGIRAQLVLAIGGLLVLALAPLLFAVASLTRATLVQTWADSSRALARAIAAHVAEARETRDDESLAPLLEAQIGQAVAALALYDPEGGVTLSRGDAAAIAKMPTHIAPDRDEIASIATERGEATLVLVPSPRGSVGVLSYSDSTAQRAAPLVRLLGLYTGLLGLTLLVFLYFVLTRIVIGPLERLRDAAGRVAEGARELSVPRGGGSELVELGSSLARMTANLRAEEQALREKVEELERTTDELQRAQESIVRSERLASVGRLAAGLAHEIGNPITAILSFQDLVLDGPLDDEQREFVERMKKETERVSRILHDLLTFARPGSVGDEDREDAVASVGEAIESVVSLVRPQKAFDDVELEVSVGDSLPAVAMRVDRIEQVLLNLLLNAADAVPRPGGRIRLEALASDGVVEIRLEDNGGGIEPSIRERLFEPFVSTKEVGEGTGLGLAVCRGLLEAAGGSIEVEDAAEGARFVLTLPVSARPD